MPNPVVGGTTVAGVVTLEEPAPQGGAQVSITSSNPGLANPSPASLTVMAGQSAANFNVNTVKPLATSYSTIKAKANGIAKSKKLTITP